MLYEKTAKHISTIPRKDMLLDIQDRERHSQREFNTCITRNALEKSLNWKEKQQQEKYQKLGRNILTKYTNSECSINASMMYIAFLHYIEYMSSYIMETNYLCVYAIFL